MNTLKIIKEVLKDKKDKAVKTIERKQKQSREYIDTKGYGTPKGFKDTIIRMQMEKDNAK